LRCVGVGGVYAHTKYNSPINKLCVFASSVASGMVVCMYILNIIHL